MSVYSKLENGYYDVMDFFEKKVKLPVYKFWVNPIEKRGVPSFPVTILVLIAIIVGLLLLFSPQFVDLKVLVKADGQPVVGALVSLSISEKQAIELTSDSNGAVVFIKQPNGAKATLEVSKTGFKTYSKSIFVSSSTQVSLSAPGADGIELTVKVVDAYDSPIRAQVSFLLRAEGASKDEEQAQETNQNGEVKLFFEKPTVVSATASAPSFDSNKANFIVATKTVKKIALKWIGARDKESYLQNIAAAYGASFASAVGTAFDGLLAQGLSDDELLGLSPQELLKRAGSSKSTSASQFASLLGKGEADVYDEATGKVVSKCAEGKTTTTVSEDGRATVSCEDGTNKTGVVKPKQPEQPPADPGDLGPGVTDFDPTNPPGCILFKTSNGEIRAYYQKENSENLLNNDEYEVKQENVSFFNASICVIPFDPPAPYDWLFKASAYAAECASGQVFDFSQLTDASNSTNKLVFNSLKNSACNQAITPPARKVKVILEMTNRKAVDRQFNFTFIFSNLLSNNSVCTSNEECGCNRCTAVAGAPSKMCCFTPNKPGEKCTAVWQCQNGLKCESGLPASQSYCCAKGNCCATDADCGSASKICSVDKSCVSCGGLNQIKCNVAPACVSGLTPNNTNFCIDPNYPVSIITFPKNNSNISTLNSLIVTKGLTIRGNASNVGLLSPATDGGSGLENVTVSFEVWSDKSNSFVKLYASQKATGLTTWSLGLPPQPFLLNGNLTRFCSKAINKAGNLQKSENCTYLRIDNVAPVIKDGKADPDKNDYSKAKISWSTSEPTNYSIFYFAEGAAASTELHDSALKTGFALNFDALEGGTHYYFSLTVTDSFGNPAKVYSEFTTKAAPTPIPTPTPTSTPTPSAAPVKSDTLGDCAIDSDCGTPGDICRDWNIQSFDCHTGNMKYENSRVCVPSAFKWGSGGASCSSSGFWDCQIFGFNCGTDNVCHECQGVNEACNSGNSKCCWALDCVNGICVDAGYCKPPGDVSGLFNPNPNCPPLGIC